MRDDSPLQQLGETVGMVSLLLLLALLTSCLPEKSNHTVDVEGLLKECEKELPRSKTCRIIAVGDKED